MSEVVDITVKLLEDFNKEIQEDLTRKGINNTKRAFKSLRIEVDKEKRQVKSIGVDYIEILNLGRGPGRRPPIRKINQWVETKLGLTGREGLSVAFAVANKIKKLGTEIFNDKKKGLTIENKVITLRDELKKAIPKGAKADLLNELRKFNKERLSNAI